MATLVIAPIPQEFEVLAAVFETRWGSPTSHKAGSTAVHEYRTADVFLAEGGFGKVQFAVTTRHLLDHLSEVSLVVCAGVAGALAPSVRVGDVVIGTATIEHDFYSVMFKGVPPRFDGSRQHLAELIQNIEAEQNSFRVHFAPIASGDQAIVDTKRRAEVYARTEALAVAFEGAGGARAATLSDVPYLEVRGVSDMADEGFVDEFEANLPTAAGNVASVVVWLVEHPVPPQAAEGTK